MGDKVDYLKMKSPLSKARNLGTSGNGVHHWWHQRFTSVLMIPLAIWLLFFICSIYGKSFEEFLSALSMPCNLTLVVLFLSAAFYHGTIGMKVIIEDYVSNIKIRFLLIMLLQIFSIVTLLSAIIALLFLGRL